MTETVQFSSPRVWFSFTSNFSRALLRSIDPRDGGMAVLWQVQFFFGLDRNLLAKPKRVTIQNMEESKKMNKERKKIIGYSTTPTSSLMYASIFDHVISSCINLCTRVHWRATIDSPKLSQHEEHKHNFFPRINKELRKKHEEGKIGNIWKEIFFYDL